MKLSYEAFLDIEFRKESKNGPEFIKFVSEETFLHKFAGGEWSKHPYSILDDGFDLHWGKGAVFRCIFSGGGSSSSQFIEMNPDGPYTWKHETKRFQYDDRGSTGPNDH